MRLAVQARSNPISVCPHRSRSKVFRAKPQTTPPATSGLFLRTAPSLPSLSATLDPFKPGPSLCRQHHNPPLRQAMPSKRRRRSCPDIRFGSWVCSHGSPDAASPGTPTPASAQQTQGTSLSGRISERLAASHSEGMNCLSVSGDSEVPSPPKTLLRQA